ncbi:MAG: TetR family transcriptional regulator [Propionicimonas sp.]|uniref:TetR/AcrR family transcriptional regulator n=1 Tax=Propionicimonas sp. TaxID=1955623 RepID=UPI002B21FB23|nr:TetR family transcriptional regulator [Propionicimonas sp.]MEA4945162.1 TetR family transcriptional regulator [Propionicimonas sp.]MEA5053889.1 TetR family transcriptional regulator [Propionicimonas sp.]
MPGNARGQQRRQAILRAAIQVVARGGAGALTHRATAAEAGVSLASVTYHFPGINDLRRATFTHAADVVGPDFAGTLDCEANQDAAVAALVRRWREVGLARQAEFLALFSLLVESLHDPDLGNQVDALLAAPAAMLVAEGCSQELAEGVVAALVGLALVSLAQRPAVGGDASAMAARRFEQSAVALFGGQGASDRDTIDRIAPGNHRMKETPHD